MRVTYRTEPRGQLTLERGRVRLPEPQVANLFTQGLPYMPVAIVSEIMGCRIGICSPDVAGRLAVQAEAGVFQVRFAHRKGEHDHRQSGSTAVTQRRAGFEEMQCDGARFGEMGFTAVRAGHSP